jgi:hypothetical protein
MGARLANWEERISSTCSGRDVMGLSLSRHCGATRLQRLGRPLDDPKRECASPVPGSLRRCIIAGAERPKCLQRPAPAAPGCQLLDRTDRLFCACVI